MPACTAVVEFGVVVGVEYPNQPAPGLIRRDFGHLRQRHHGNLARLSGIAQALDLAARGTRNGLIEPMIQAYLKDAEVVALLDKLHTRRAEWRRTLPKASMRVPVPGIVAAN